MNSIQENGTSSYQAKTKAQLFEEVETLQEAVHEKNAEIEELKSELENVRKSKSNSNGLRRELEEKKSEIERLLADFEEAHQGLKNLQRENSSLQETIQEVEEKNQVLEDQAKANQEKHAKEIKGLNAQLETAESQKRQSDQKIKELQKSLDAMKSPAHLAEEAIQPKQEYKGAKSTFRIEIYKRQGELLGRIEHPLSLEKQSFTGVDEAKIIQFISKHLPVSGEPEKSIAEDRKAELEITDFKIMLASGKPLQHVLLKGQSYYFDFNFDSSGIVIGAENPLQFDVSIFGKNMQSGAKLLLGQTRLRYADGGKHAVNIGGVPLPTGTYRLELLVNSKYPDGNPALYNLAAQPGFLYVQ